MKDETVILMVAVDVDDLFVVGGAKEVAEFHDTLSNKFPTNIVRELSRYTRYRLRIRTNFQGRDH